MTLSYKATSGAKGVMFQGRARNNGFSKDTEAYNRITCSSGPTVEYRCTTAQGMYKTRKESLNVVKREEKKEKKNIIPFARKDTILGN